MSAQPYRLLAGGSIDRSVCVAFTFDGRSYTGHPGDTLASALLANGVRLLGRSFKYHRPRGIHSCGPEEPSALITVDHGSLAEPNTQATTVELYEGLIARSQNCWPSLRLDLMSVNQVAAPLIPAGFYYKTFMWPGSWWMFYERFIRRAAGLGTASRGRDPSRFEHAHVFCDVLVVGAGPAGLTAALVAGRAGARVALVESEPILGGALWRDQEEIDGGGADQWLQQISAQLAALPNVRVMLRTTAFGYYDHNTVAALERIVRPRTGQATQRMHVVRARRVVLATGALERPAMFEGNDRPGVMLAGAVRTYVERFAVVPGRRAVVYTNNDDAYRTALCLHRAGVGVQAIIDSRTVAEGSLSREARGLGIQCLTGRAVLRAHGRFGVKAIDVVHLGAGKDTAAKLMRIECDLLAVSGGWSPTVQLFSQSGGKLKPDQTFSGFVPASSRQAETSAGAASGAWSLSACLASGAAAGAAAATALGLRAAEYVAPAAAEWAGGTGEPLWVVPGAERYAFVDLQNDVTVADVMLAHREGYESIEHLKRYTTLGMGTDQGKTGNLNGLAIMAGLQGRSIGDLGTTTFRPPYSPVGVGAFAGRERDLNYRPVRRSPMHDWHAANGAQMAEMGLWMRPRCYPQAGAGVREAYIREAAHVRNAVGMIDISTLGKIDIQGPDAVELLERVYANKWRSLPPGRVRYGLMLREDGMVFDDGTTARLSEQHYVMSTTTANAAKVLQHLEFLLQVVWPTLRVHVVSITDQWGAIALAGPKSRAVLSRVIDGAAAAASDDALPHLAVVSARVAGVPCRVFRMTYSGELAYEIAAPADRALEVWEALLGAGRIDDIQPYGTEAMGALRIEKGHVAAPELDGRTTADDIGLSALVGGKGDFIGCRLAQRPALRDPQRMQLVGLLSIDPTARLRAGAQIVVSSWKGGDTPTFGHVSSATFSPTLGRDIALGFVQRGRGRIGETVCAAFPLRNESVAVRIVESVFYDKQGSRYRG